MSLPSTARITASAKVPAALQASAEQVATHLGKSVGAWVCYLALTERINRAPYLVVVGGCADDTPSWQNLGGAALLRRVLSTREPLLTQAGEWPALALHLSHEGRMVGGTILLYAEEAAIDAERATAAAHLAASALDSARQIAALYLQAEEIEERTRVREIQVSRNLIRGVIDSIPMGLALLDSQGIVLAVNRALSERFGVEPVNLVGEAYNTTIGLWDTSPAAQTFLSGVAGKVRRTVTRPDGARTLLEIASIPLLDGDGRPHQVVEVWEDITERVALQTQLVRVEKLAAIGHLAASIAHEVGNPLQAIQGFLALFLEQCPTETPNRHYLTLAEEEIERIVQVLARLRDLYRPRADVIGAIDLNALLDSVLLLTSKQLERGHIRVLREQDLDLPRIQGVADQLKQVLLNLVLNAAEAMSGSGGMLHIQTYAFHDQANKPGITITITDTGTGIPPDQLPHIFDGLHTTKERGMGLGLYTSKAIIERHMGRISVQSIPGEGTTFTILLPIGVEENAI